MSNTITSKSKAGNKKGGKLYIMLASACALVVAILVFTVFQGATDKEPYYVLGQDIPARTEIIPSMLIEQEAMSGTAPPNAIDIGTVSEGGLYSLVALNMGDILTESNTSNDQSSLWAGLPENFVITSFTVEPNLAAGGNIQRGDYIDVGLISSDTAMTGGEAGAAIFLKRVLVIDATVDLAAFTPSEEEGANEEVDKRSGIPTTYTVGLSPENAAKLALAGEYKLFAVLSSIETRDSDELTAEEILAGAGTLWGTTTDAGEGTDNTFGLGGEDIKKPTNNNNGNEDTDTSEPTNPDEETSEPTTSPTEEPATEETQ